MNKYGWVSSSLLGFAERTRVFEDEDENEEEDDKALIGD
jgi:hypothetical protein